MHGMIALMAALMAIMLFFFSAFDVHADIYKHISEDGVIFFSNSSLGADSKVVVRERIVRRKSDNENNSADSGPQKVADMPRSQNLDTFHAVVDEKARMHNVDPQLVNAVIRAESNWNPDAVSPKGALGLMQLMPSTAALLGVSNAFDPFENIDGGVRYLKYLIGRFNGNLVLALAAYNAGPQLVEKKGSVPSIPETIAYVKRVMRYYNGEPWIASDANSQEIQRDITKEFKRIKRVVLEDGTLLFTNSYSARSF